MSKEFTCTIPGPPRPQKHHFGRNMHDPSADDKTAAIWCLKTAKAVQRWQTIERGPIEIEVFYIFPRPKSRKHDTFHFVKPDEDNLTKLLKDACTRAGIWKDDCQVCKANYLKIYVTVGKPRTTITVRRIED